MKCLGISYTRFIDLVRALFFSCTVVGMCPLSNFSLGNPVEEENKILEKIEGAFLDGEFMEAKKIWQENSQEYPSSILFNYWGGKILLYCPEQNMSKKNKNFRQAISYLDRVSEGFKSSQLVNDRAKKLSLESTYHISLALFLLHDVSGAIRAMRNVIQIDDRLPSTWFNMAIFYEILGRKDESRIAHNRYLALSSKEDDDF